MERRRRIITDTAGTDFPSPHTPKQVMDLPSPIVPLVPYRHPELEEITRQCPPSLHHHHHHSLDPFSLGLHLARYFGHHYGEKFVAYWGPRHVVMCMDLMVWSYGQEPLRSPALSNPAAILTAKVRESKAGIRRQHQLASQRAERTHGRVACLCRLCFDQGLGIAQDLPRAKAGGALDQAPPPGALNHPHPASPEKPQHTKKR